MLGLNLGPCVDCVLYPRAAGMSLCEHKAFNEHAQCWNMVQEWSQLSRDFGELVRTRVLWPQFLQNTELFLDCVFPLLPDVADRSESISAVVIWFLYRKTSFCHVQPVPVTVHLTQVTPLHPQRTLMLWLNRPLVHLIFRLPPPRPSCQLEWSTGSATNHSPEVGYEIRERGRLSEHKGPETREGCALCGARASFLKKDHKCNSWFPEGTLEDEVKTKSKRISKGIKTSRKDLQPTLGHLVINSDCHWNP